MSARDGRRADPTAHTALARLSVPQPPPRLLLELYREITEASRDRHGTQLLDCLLKRAT